MSSITTSFGELSGVEFKTLFSNGKTDGCLVSKPNLLKTPYGELVPLYESEDMGRRTQKPMYFYKNGAIKSIALQSRTLIDTPAGQVPAELVTFYASGSIRRIFPLDGKLSGYWTAKNEFSLAEEVAITTPLGTVSCKFIGLQFYESGALKSITLWPGQQMTVMTPAGEIRIRTGIAFYENGAIRSLEPAKPVQVETPAGLVTAYDNEPQGIHGDLNSLQLTPEGSVEGLSTTKEEVIVLDHHGKEHRFHPALKNNVCGNERKVVVPMKMHFRDGRIILHDNPASSFCLEKCTVQVRPFERKAEDPMYSCSN
jgi:hypothetical protein